MEKSSGINEIREVLAETIKKRPDNVIYGTDWSMCKMDEHIKLIKSLNLEADVEEKIFYKNAV